MNAPFTATGWLCSGGVAGLLAFSTSVRFLSAAMRLVATFSTSIAGLRFFISAFSAVLRVGGKALSEQAR